MDHTTYTVFSSSNVKGWGWSRRRGFSYAESACGSAALPRRGLSCLHGSAMMRKPVKVPRPAPKVYRVNRPHRKNILCVNFMRIVPDWHVRSN